MESSHTKFLHRNGVSMYNNYFNRDNKKKNVVEIAKWLSKDIRTEEFQNFVDELDARPKEEQIYLLKNLIAIAVKNMGDSPPTRVVNKYFKDLEAGGKEELLLILKDYYDQKVNYATGKEHKSTSFGVPKLVKYDPFLYEYRDGENAVPRPPENEKHLVEPDKSLYKIIPLEYIREHGVLEFILKSEYLYSLESLFYYSKPSEYQIEYLKKLIKEGRLTQKVFRL